MEGAADVQTSTLDRPLDVRQSTDVGPTDSVVRRSSTGVKVFTNGGKTGESGITCNYNSSHEKPCRINKWNPYILYADLQLVNYNMKI